MKLVYFSWIRERLDTGEEEVDLPQEVATVADLLNWLKSRDELWRDVLEHDNIIRVALDQEHVRDHSASLSGIREVAIFPPMTGG